MNSRTVRIATNFFVVAILAAGGCLISVLIAISPIEFSYSPESGVNFVIDVSKIVREYHQAERMKQLSRSLAPLCAEENFQCSLRIDGMSTHTPVVKPLIETLIETSNFSLGWGWTYDQSTNDYLSNGVYGRPFMKFNSNTGFDIPFNRPVVAP